MTVRTVIFAIATTFFAIAVMLYLTRALDWKNNKHFYMHYIRIHLQKEFPKALS
jgi:hypothetical protein